MESARATILAALALAALAVPAAGAAAQESVYDPDPLQRAIVADAIEFFDRYMPSRQEPAR